ncbi:phosphotransferase family protein [Kitasatospora acidiphila]|uniref:phosphotransferase family protein n=1 Tax=Kitasatospora acidiphila TaxID=2567942 RepID=UPI001C67AAB3|nr:phosphotransferase [Kitasatospora acidiphila]
MIDSPPPPAALAWASELAGPAAGAWAVQRLAGGAHAATHLLRTPDSSTELVLRRFPPGDRAPAYEARVLAAIDGLDGWAPRLAGADPDGLRFGEPAVLITRLPGHADITPACPETAAEQLGRALARIHSVPLARLSGLRDGMAASASVTRSAGRGPAAPVLAAHADRLAGRPPVLTHYDYWSGNVLWQHDVITGIVDWSGASLAPRGFDVSWCRLDLVLLHGPGTAEVFLTAYQEAAGEKLSDVALWDLFALTNSYRTVETWVPNYHDLGRTDLTAAKLRQRHTEWTEDRLARLPENSYEPCDRPR